MYVTILSTFNCQAAFN